jgi:FtsP/CotA-like multicopper oxidase with cupredoxin domain
MVKLEAREFDWEVAPGRVVKGFGFNGQVPGPAIEADVGDELVVELTNRLPEPTTIHWHGLRVPAAMDGTELVQRAVATGETFEYRFVLPDAPRRTWEAVAGKDSRPVARHQAARPRRRRANTDDRHEGADARRPRQRDDPVRVGDLQVWELMNETGQDHPFHVHGFFFQVVDEPGAPAWKDTVNVPRRQSVRIAWLPDDRPGAWMYHCHILEHHAMGMMAYFDVVR